MQGDVRPFRDEQFLAQLFFPVAKSRDSGVESNPSVKNAQKNADVALDRTESQEILQGLQNQLAQLQQHNQITSAALASMEKRLSALEARVDTHVQTNGFPEKRDEGGS
jgi:septal ring factor EnvC (AmiA/AmiB activator)